LKLAAWFLLKAKIIFLFTVHPNSVIFKPFGAGRLLMIIESSVALSICHDITFNNETQCRIDCL